MKLVATRHPVTAVIAACAPVLAHTRSRSDLAHITQSQEIRERFAAGGMEAVSFPPEEFSAILKRDVTRWASVVKRAGIKQHH